MSQPVPVVLIIEDELQMRRVIRAVLRSQEYAVVEAGSAKEGLMQAAGRNPDIILLDLGLPDLDGLDLTRELRARTSAPIIVLSARGKELDKVTALDCGADDYLTKPFSEAELLARIRVSLRHANQGADGASEPIFEAGDLKVDLVRREVLKGGEEVHLTPTEYKLLATLIKNAGRVVTHDQLLIAVWGNNYRDQTQYVRVYMGQLRHKLEDDPARPRLLTTEPGVGYRLRGENG